MLAMAISIHQPLLAAQNHHSSSSSTQKEDKFCKKANKLLKQIDQTTMQDLVVDQTILNVVNQINQTTAADLAVDQEILADVEQLLDCSCTCIVIEPADFEDSDGNLTQTYVITTPGNYCLGADVAFVPVDEFTPAINILSDDVNLDLRGFTLSQANATPNAYGVQIGQGYNYNDPDAVLKNITVKNGSIINFIGIGVFCYNGSFDEPTAELAFQDLHFFDLNILDCGSNESADFASGIDLDSAAGTTLSDLDLPVAYKNVIIRNCNINRCIGTGAISVYTGDNIVLENTMANDLSLEIDVIGGNWAYFFTARNIQMSHCQGNNVNNFDGTGLGLYLEDCINIYIKTCQFNDTFSATGSAAGGHLETVVQNFIAEDCQFNNSRTGDESNGFAVGVEIGQDTSQEARSSGIKFINCQFNGARATGAGGTDNSWVGGVLADIGSDVLFESCQACNIFTDSPGYRGIGWLLASYQFNPSVFPDMYNLTFSNCVASDITAGLEAYGIAAVVANTSRNGIQGLQINTTFENCIAERIQCDTSTQRVAGISASLIDLGTNQYPLNMNVFIKGCRVSDIRSNSESPSPLSAGILVESVVNPVLQNNSVSDSDRGILFTGTNDVIPNCFQLAATQADALANPPVFVPLEVQLQVSISPDPDGINPIQAFYTTNGPRLTAPISAPAEVTNPPGACSTVTNDLTGEIGIVLSDGACNSSVLVLNAEAAGDVATLIINIQGADPTNYGGSPNQTNVAVVINSADGDALLQSLAANPGSIITIDTVPTSSNTYAFNNITQGNSIEVSAGQIDSIHGFICPTANLTGLGWQPGDQIVFDCNGNPSIPGLVCGTTYYAIVYIPGFSRNGLIQDNKVDNCSISCYQDDAPVTSSAWVNNTAFNCGTPPSIPPSSETNYTINFAGCRPIDVGSLEAYPKDGHKYLNLSLVPFGPPCPPQDFVGTLSHKIYSSSSSNTHYTIHAHWRPSPSNDVVAYNIYKDDQLIKTVPSNASLRVKIRTAFGKTFKQKV